jgi:hypothetical protein
MKRKPVIIALLLLLMSGKLFSLDFNFARDFLTSYNGIITDDRYASYYFSVDLVNFNIMNTDSSIGLFISPLRYSFISPPQTQSLSFVNIKAYYNILDKKANYYDEVENIIGPYFSINWMNLKDYNEFDLRNFVCSTGMLFSIRHFAGGSAYNIKDFLRQPEIINYITFEFGYIYTYGKSDFYVGVYIGDPFMISSTVLYYIFALFGYYPV